MKMAVSREEWFTRYETMGLIFGSATLGWSAGHKTFHPHSKFDSATPKILRHDANGFCIYTGVASDCCVIDLDDVERPEQRHLEKLMETCTAVQRTRRGRHYMFRYDERLRTTTNDEHKIDIRADGACIICCPSAYITDDGAVEYTWERFGPLVSCPETVITYLEELGVLRRVISSDPIEEIDNDTRIRPLLQKLPAHYWNNYSDWLTIGMALFNEGCSVELWDEFSQLCDTAGKYKSGECTAKWLTFRKDSDRKVSAKTLHMWVGSDEVIDDVYACKRFIEYMGDEIHRDGEDVYVFDPTTGLWDNSDRAVLAAVHRHKAKLIFNVGGNTLNYGGSTRNIKNMLVHLTAMLPDDGFIRRGLDGAMSYLLFADGVFHVPTRTFEKGFDKRRVFLARIGRPFPGVRDYSLEEAVNRALFIEPVESVDVGCYLKTCLARAIAGCYRDKRFLCTIGEANSSKGTITTAMRAAFGAYVNEWNANNIKYNGRSGADEAKKLAWLAPLRACRLAISNECRMDKVPIDGNLLKTLSSGGDMVSVRQNFKDEVGMIVKTAFVYMGNDMPEITPKDTGIQARMRVVRFTKQFVETPIGPNQIKADPTIKEKLGTDEWANAVFWLIVDAFGEIGVEPTEVQKETKEWIPNDVENFREVIEERFTLTGCDTDYVAAKDIIGHVKGAGMNLSDTKIGRLLGQMNLVRDDKWISGKTVRVWKGVKEGTTLVLDH
jgi:hypothetical protein